MNAQAAASLTGRPARPSLLDQENLASPAFSQPKAPYFKCDKARFDALLRALSGVELKVALAVERHTRGHYSQEEAEISVSLLVEWTGCSKNAVLKARQRLISEGVLQELQPPTRRRAARLRLNPNPSLWGAFSVAHNMHHPTLRGIEDGPQRSTLETSRGAGQIPPEVTALHPLNGLNGYEDLSERGTRSADNPKGSPTDRLAAFYAAVETGPECVRAKLTRGVLNQGESE